jgi:hypothetical protein
MLGTESRKASDVPAGIQAPNGRSSMEDMVAKTQTPLQRIARVALRWIFTLVGIAGLFLPVLPGVFLVSCRRPPAESSKYVAAASGQMSSEVFRPGSRL